MVGGWVMDGGRDGDGWWWVMVDSVGWLMIVVGGHL